DLIPDIFICALHLSTSMKLIHYAETTLSERGTSELFCNTEGREYFEFLISDFSSELNEFYKKIEDFNKRSSEYAYETCKSERKQLSKHTELGQYTRFQAVFASIKDDKEKLSDCLSETTQKIKQFAGVSPEESLKKKEMLYSAIRK